MGQKINPVGVRLRNIRKWKANWFLASKNYTDFLLLNYEINKYLLGVFRNSTKKSFIIDCYIGKISLDKLYVFVFFYRLKKKRKYISVKQSRKKMFLRYNLEKLVIQQNFKEFIKFKKMNKQLKLLDINTIFFSLIHKKKKNYKNFKKWSLISLINYYKKRPEKLLNNKYNLLKKNSFLIRKKKIVSFGNLDVTTKLRGNYKTIQKIKLSLSELTNANTKLILINVLGFVNFYKHLTKLHFKYNLKFETTVHEFARFEFQMVSWFRYTVRFIKDVTNLAFITFLLKQPSFLAKFIGYQLYRTPRKFTHGKIIFFIIQLVKFIYATRAEITGLRIQFKGRINGKRRAKRKQFVNFGELLLPTYQSYIEYGSAHGITRYGVMGIKIWFCYKPYFDFIVQKFFLLYFDYSRQRQINKLNNKQLKKFNINRKRSNKPFKKMVN
jgi:ribosomal protein S3